MPQPPVKVLLVDDDEDDYIITRDLISQIQDRQHQLAWVNSYQTGLAALQRNAYDICLLDYRLGERTGLELLRETQSLNRRPPVILLTGQGDHEIDLEAMMAGAADYLLKGQLDSDKLERAMRFAMADQHAKERLRRDRDLISRIMETSPVGIVVTDKDGNINFANHRAEEVLGLTKEAISRRSCSVLDWQVTDLEGNTLAGQSSPLKNVLESGLPVQDVRQVAGSSLPAESAAERRTLLSTNATPLFNAQGKIDGMVVTVEDITSRLLLEAQLRQSQKMESVGQLAAGVAHDINNILTVIQGHAGLLLNVAPKDSAPARSLKQILAASERAASFVRQLLTFSRKQIFRSKILDLNAVLENLATMLPPMLGEDIILETRYQPGLPHVDADAGMLEQIVMNLAVNARDAMPRGGRLLIASRSADIGADYTRQHPDARQGSFVCLTVTDTGCGMERKVLRRIFEPFFTTKKVGKGTGLGLATTYGIVKQHQGWIEVRSEVNAGTTFEVFLPVACEPHSAPPVPATPAEFVRGGDETILVVEDEPRLLELVRNVLKGYHYRVLIAASGAEAVRVWEENDGQIDLLLTDMIMPGGMTGGELAAELENRKPGLKVVFTSGYSSELVGRNISRNRHRFIAKPFLPLRLAQVIRNCLDDAPPVHVHGAPGHTAAHPAPATHTA
jgi:signal transduction histidine kinase/DNA-binding response OmpR family regulator